MDHAGRQLLARAVRPGNHDPAVGRRHFLDGLAQMVDGARSPDHDRALHAAFAQLPVLALQLGCFERALGDQHEPVGLERLLDIVVGAALDRRDGGLDIAVARDDDDGEIRMGLADAVEHLEPVEPAALQPDVENDERGAPLLDGRKGLLAVLGDARPMTFVFEDAGDQIANVGFVVDDENVRRHESAPSRA
jgi:hypothetical protein